MVSGALLGDSILKNLPDVSLRALQKKFGLTHKPRLFCFGGYSTYDLISRSGMIEMIMDQEPCLDKLFLCSRSNDARTYPNGSVESRTCKLFEDYQNLISDLRKRYPRLMIYALPQPRRFLSKIFSERFPENSNPEFIADQNDIISLFQEKMLVSEEVSNFKFMPSPPLDVWKSIMADDGLHLTDL